MPHRAVAEKGAFAGDACPTLPNGRCLPQHEGGERFVYRAGAEKNEAPPSRRRGGVDAASPRAAARADVRPAVYPLPPELLGQFPSYPLHGKGSLPAVGERIRSHKPHLPRLGAGAVFHAFPCILTYRPLQKSSPGVSRKETPGLPFRGGSVCRVLRRRVPDFFRELAVPAGAGGNGRMPRQKF